jgi:queuine tRNA-ribosyltransferase subunit QTRTD1
MVVVLGKNSFKHRLPTTRLTNICRLRGYQFKSEGPNERKRNSAPFTVYKANPDKSEKITQKGSVPVPGPEAIAEDLEKVGFAEKSG